MEHSNEQKKVIATYDENGRWSIKIKGVVTMRDINQLKRGLHIAFGQHLRQARLQRLTNRVQALQTPTVKEPTDGD